MSGFLKAGLLGWPVSHSMSPAIHREFMTRAGITGEYRLFPVKPEDLAEKVESVRREGYRGLNITLPHKQSAMKLCTVISEEALKACAVNTLVAAGEHFSGHNTDVGGFRVFAGELPPPFFVLGHGGAARAVLAAMGARKCFILGRGESIPDNRLGEKGTIVNATPLGWRNRDPFPLKIHSGWSFADLNYNPFWRWRNSLEHQGVNVRTGERMLVEQAACSFALWTGYTPEEELKQTVLERIKAILHG
jgi:shikimate dehydrogenase